MRRLLYFAFHLEEINGEIKDSSIWTILFLQYPVRNSSVVYVWGLQKWLNSSQFCLGSTESQERSFELLQHQLNAFNDLLCHLWFIAHFGSLYVWYICHFTIGSPIYNSEQRGNIRCITCFREFSVLWIQKTSQDWTQGMAFFPPVSCFSLLVLEGYFN